MSDSEFAEGSNTAVEAAPEESAVTQPEGDASSPSDASVDTDRAIFDQVMERQDAGDAELEEVMAEDDGEDNSTDESDRESESQQSSETTEDIAQDAPEGFDEALKAFKRDRLSDKAIQAIWAQDPEAFVSDGRKRAEAQRELDRKFSARGREQAESKASPKGKDQIDAPNDFVDAAKKASDEVLGSIQDDDPMYGENLREVVGIMNTKLAEQFFALHESKTKDLLSEIDGLKGFQASLQQERLNDQLEKGRESLKEKYPAISDNSEYERVLTEYDSLVAAKSYNSPQEALDDAAAIAFKDLRISQLRDQLLTKKIARKAGTPRKPTNGTPNKPLTPEMLERRKFDRIYDKEFGARR